ncbi:glycoside hydrolase family 43 protein [Glonium stellatum]|uniref:arabinan endo-1,5-alpha-L-arabinosidase n=1 Tax=Glonium stellatum TaxID=574774 RepID=A0A8E2EVJ2_9PEZI|nr:glycoside hydrolase family 43 protein [Glonium stellatum]
MRFFSALISSIVLLASSANAYANPGACSGTCNNAHDPSLIRRSSDGTYFRFSTGGGIAIHTAPAITGPWTYQGYALSNGTYYLYYAVSTFGSQDSAIGLATSSTMDVGTWTDLGATGVASDSTKIYNAIDPYLIVVGSSYYLNFGSFWDDIYQVAMASTPTKTAGTSSYIIAYNSSGTHAEEGSYMFYYSGYYYLFFSRGICCGYDTSRPATGAEYSVMVDKSGNSCTTNGGTVVLASHGTVYGPGGQGIYNDPTYGPVIYYHYGTYPCLLDTTIGYVDSQKVFGWNTITWSSWYKID